MSGSATSRIPANWVGLTLVLLLAVWLGFTLFPRGEKPAPVIAPVVVESKLHAVGLEDNPDWEGLPEFFAIWADRAEWKDNQTRFFYWNPGMNAYSYEFEAVRVNGSYRFKVISESADPSEEELNSDLPEDCPIRFYYSVHMGEVIGDPPFNFPVRPASSSSDQDKVKLDIVAPRIPLSDPKIIPVKPTPKS